MAQQSEKMYTIRPSWKYFALPYLYSIILIPVFGIGLVALFFVWKKHRQYLYRIHDTHIEARDSEYVQNLDLVNIKRAEVEQNWVHRKFNVGKITLFTDENRMELFGIHEPFKLKETIELASAKLRQQQKKREKQKPRPQPEKPGKVDRMNYLTGLWQQGLISNEDHDEERKNFE